MCHRPAIDIDIPLYLQQPNIDHAKSLNTKAFIELTEQWQCCILYIYIPVGTMHL